ncbi:MAG: regulatory protein GemA [Desulfovibrionaceae bacterium]
MAVIIQFPTRQAVPTAAPAPRAAPAMPPINQRANPSDQRTMMLGKIHIAKKQLMDTLPGFDDTVYRDTLHNLFGASSAADLNQRQMHSLLLHFAGLGFTAKKGRHRKKAPAVLSHDSANMGREALMEKIEAQLAEKGRAENTEMPWGYAVSILKRQSGGLTKAFAQATPEQLNYVIAALYRDAKRKGRKVR